ncbi:OsmC family protein [Fictibacillus phosphorivorans]|uniref:OsmC family protein n=1 Tax=Fictibacillus phosphorivorans TaxID=1221500 RepID=UPI00203E8C1E|nr:OsmC family protein [Fictibacillus phosphorivorans]MCM3719050.1 OsmC family protein [Fictibacillus phosphorivorans]MCM3776672.1 OsmC family protein [Fictibacillus phosphorivorans]
MAQHVFHLKAHWPGGRNDTGSIAMKNLKTMVSIPPEMDGPGIGTNPDEMLLGAAATCYIITLAAMMERSNVNNIDLTMESEGIVDVTNGVITYKKIIHRPTVIIKQEQLKNISALLHKLAIKAENSCMISRALKGNVEIEANLTIKTQ